MNSLRSVAAALAAGLVLWSGTAVAQSKPGCEAAKMSTPQTVDGQVVKLDKGQNKVTVRGADGSTHEFQASKETLRDLKVGDRIEAKLRAIPDC